jgi:hypothetical protein
MVRFEKGIAATSGNSEQEAAEGLSLFLGVCDEIAAFRTRHEIRGQGLRNKLSAEGIYGVMKSSATSRFPTVGKIVLISYPRYEGDFIQKKYEEGLKLDETYTVLAKTWEMNPIRKESDFDKEKKRNLTEWKAKYCCEPPMAIDAFYDIPDKIDEVIDYSIQNPVTSVFDNWFYSKTMNKNLVRAIFEKNFEGNQRFNYNVHIDLALSGDACGIVMTHKDREKIVMDLVMRLVAKHDVNIDFEKVREIIFELTRRNFNVSTVTMDGWNSVDMIQILTRSGYAASRISVDRTLLHHHSLKGLIYEKKIKLIDDPILITELKQLSLIRGKKVDHPPEGSKDLADALAGAAHGSILEVEQSFWMPENGIEAIISTNDNIFKHDMISKRRPF